MIDGMLKLLLGIRSKGARDADRLSRPAAESDVGTQIAFSGVHLQSTQSGTMMRLKGGHMRMTGVCGEHFGQRRTTLRLPSMVCRVVFGGSAASKVEAYALDSRSATRPPNRLNVAAQPFTKPRPALITRRDCRVPMHEG